jgi:hypothetical protein
MVKRVSGAVLLFGLVCVPACSGDRTPVYNLEHRHFRDGANDLGIVERVEMAYRKDAPGAEITVYFRPFHDKEGKLIEDRKVKWNIDDREAEAVGACQKIKLTRDRAESKVFQVSLRNADGR